MLIDGSHVKLSTVEQDKLETAARVLQEALAQGLDSFDASRCSKTEAFLWALAGDQKRLLLDKD